MKRKLFLTLAITAISAISAWAGAEIKFDTTTHDFGRIDANGGVVTAIYPFTNVGDEPLVIVSVTNGGCGCTRPTFTTHPVKPGEKGEVKITFDPKGRSGALNRKVLVQVSGQKKRVGLKFSGTVIP